MIKLSFGWNTKIICLSEMKLLSHNTKYAKYSWASIIFRSRVYICIKNSGESSEGVIES